MRWRNLCFVFIFIFLPLSPYIEAKTTIANTNQELVIGLLANRGSIVGYTEYEAMAKALSQNSKYSYKITPLTFDQVKNAIQEKEIDFLITNPSFYVELESLFGIMRIATLQGSFYNDFSLPKFGGVLFTSSKNISIRSTEDIFKTKIVAVDRNSFGGYVSLWYELLRDYGIDISENVTFEGSHDRVIRRVLSNPREAGIVRTDIIERMIKEGSLKKDDIKLIISKVHPRFPFLCSTELYPEWAFAALSSTPSKIAEETMIKLLRLDKAESNLIWTIPLDYGDIHTAHKFLRLPPYDLPFSLNEFIKTYKYQILTFFFIIVLVLILLIKLSWANKRYNQINTSLNEIVEQKTQELTEANEHLKTLVNTDELTKISSRRYFFDLSETYLQLSIRQNKPLFLLSLDIDHFKKVNDQYGHNIGDKVLYFFCAQVSKCLRKSDIFGRVGGEEFGVCIIDTTLDGAMSLAEKIRFNIESTPFIDDKTTINLSVSIGVAFSNVEDISIETILNRADQALYEAKNSGRNRVKLWKKSDT